VTEVLLPNILVLDVHNLIIGLIYGLSRYNRVYRPGETVSGHAVINAKGSHSHGGVMIKVEGTVQLQLSPNSVGLLESLSSTMKPIGLISFTKEILAPGKFVDGKTSVPFEFKLNPSGPRRLLETYHGVYICVQYMLTIEVNHPTCFSPRKRVIHVTMQVQRGSLFSQAMQEITEFIVEVPVRAGI
jgi:hypothetical protein